MGILIKMNNLIYDLSESSYDTVAKIYNNIEYTDITQSLTDSVLTYDYLTSTVNIGDETFSPLSKIDNFSILSSSESTINVSGYKTDSEYIQMMEDITINPNYDVKITSINIIYTGEVGVVYSTDSGSTWVTKSGVVEFSESVEWFSVDDIRNIVLDTTKIRLAFILRNDAIVTNIDCMVDKIDSFIKIKRSEYDTYFDGNDIIIYPSNDVSNLKINILAKGIVSDIPKLSTPAIVNTDGVISWMSIPNATNYDIFINGVKHLSTIDLSYTLEDLDAFTIICIRATGDNYISSDYSNIVANGILDNNTYLSVMDSDGINKFLLLRDENGNEFRIVIPIETKEE